MNITKGMAKAMSGLRIHATCSCGMSIPKYTGRYPAKCPSCGGDLKTHVDAEDGTCEGKAGEFLTRIGKK